MIGEVYKNQLFKPLRFLVCFPHPLSSDSNFPKTATDPHFFQPLGFFKDHSLSLLKKAIINHNADQTHHFHRAVVTGIWSVFLAYLPYTFPPFHPHRRQT